MVLEKVGYTVLAGVAYLAMAQMPLAGIEQTTSDPLYWLRPVLGGTKGSILDFGVSSIVASTYGLNLLYAAGYLNRALFGNLQKHVAMLLVIAQALFATFGGVYGTGLAPFTLGLLFTQLVGAGFFAIYLDQAIQKGYGFGTGYNTYIALHIVAEFLWGAFSFRSFQTGKGTEYEGAIVALVQLVIGRRDKFRAVKEAFYRSNLPNIATLLIKVAAIGTTIYFQSTRYEVAIQHSLHRQNGGKYPIKLLYTASAPLLVVSTVIGFYTFISQVLFGLLPNNILVRVFGVWKSFDKNPQRFPSSGLAVLLTPPRHFFSIIHPISLINFAIYAAIFTAACIYISFVWPEAAGNNAKDVSKTLEAQSLVIPGRREGSIYKEMKKLIPQVSTTGGAILALIALAGDLLGSYGTGTSSVLVIVIAYQFFEIIAIDYQNRGPGETLCNPLNNP
ncbi:SecY protein [Rhizoclosmatium globosum]|uniref:SecY protein n=1 Tax=Rhizoclosmatium globosum TaxID=329046 RepID=A0A1Y2BQM3_9FUNG|nr:SecY protein [Rhizoclosmatium globosum]|eukprot:ORY37034.1 SecY protein [Rhizoclosmatium globosum]